MLTSLGLWASHLLVETEFEGWNLLAVGVDKNLKYVGETSRCSTSSIVCILTLPGSHEVRSSTAYVFLAIPQQRS